MQREWQWDMRVEGLVVQETFIKCLFFFLVNDVPSKLHFQKAWNVFRSHNAGEIW